MSKPSAEPATHWPGQGFGEGDGEGNGEGDGAGKNIFSLLRKSAWLVGIGPNKLLFLYRASNRTVLMSPLFHSNRQMILLGFTTIYKTMFNDLTIYRLPLAAEARLPAQVQDPAVAAGVPAGPAGAGLRQQLQPLPQQPPRQRRATGTHHAFCSIIRTIPN